jgi:hypothetical protein
VTVLPPARVGPPPVVDHFVSYLMRVAKRQWGRRDPLLASLAGLTVGILRIVRTDAPALIMSETFPNDRLSDPVVSEKLQCFRRYAGKIGIAERSLSTAHTGW